MVDQLDDRHINRDCLQVYWREDRVMLWILCRGRLKLFLITWMQPCHRDVVVVVRGVGVLFRQWIKLQTCSDVWSTLIKTCSDVEIKQISSAINTRKNIQVPINMFFLFSVFLIVGCLLKVSVVVTCVFSREQSRCSPAQARCTGVR